MKEEHVFGPPTPEDYRLLIERAWADIHHSRGQEWRAFVAIVAAHLAVFQAVSFSYQGSAPTGNPWPMVAGGIVSMLAAIVGVSMTRRHRRLMQIKIGWIYRAEDFLGLVRRQTEEELIEQEDRSSNLSGDAKTDMTGETGNRDWGVIPKRRKPPKTLRWKGLESPRMFSTSWLIQALYIILLMLDALVIAFPVITGALAT